MSRHTNTQHGFTLIELSIVLVIIGLIIGGILTGQDLINTAAIRAQIAQIEKYNTAVRTFQGKYGYLPGDIPNPYASNFGFLSRGSLAGLGDGNGLIESVASCTPAGNMTIGTKEMVGETIVFWEDLSTANLIDGTFTAAAFSCPGSDITTTSNPNINAYFPQAKIGNGNYLYVWSGGWAESAYGPSNGDGYNYYGLSTISKSTIGTPQRLYTSTALTVQQAYNIDTKVDDGLPQSGSVTALHLNGNLSGYAVWAAAGSNLGASLGNNAPLPITYQTQYATTNCYDNNNIAGPETYSLKNAGVSNCALSFRFQ